MIEDDERQHEAAGTLRVAIAQGRGHMEKCFSCAFEALQVLADTPASAYAENGDVGVELDRVFELIEKTFGVELSEVARELIQFNLMASFAQHGALTTCIIWGLGHVIEHATLLSGLELPAERLQ